MPEGLELHRRDDRPADPEPAESDTYGAVIGTSVAPNEFGDIVRVHIREAEADRDVEPDEQATYEIVDVHGVRARYRDDPLHAGMDWFQDRLAIAITGPQGARELVMSVARALRLPSSGDASRVQIGQLPNEHQLLTEQRVRSYQGVGYSLDAHDTGGKSPRTLMIGVASVPTGSVAPATFTVGNKLRALQVRGGGGAAGLTSTTLPVPEGSGTFAFDYVTLVWLEYPDVLVNVAASGIEFDEVVAVAESLDEASEQEWLSLPRR